MDKFYFKIVGALIFAWASVAVLAAAENGAVPDVNVIVANMVRAQAQNRAQQTAYEVLRNYRIFHPEEAQTKAKGQVTALVSFLPPHSKTYKIEQSTGGIVERVVRNTLQREVELTKDPAQSDLNPENYSFELLGWESLQGNPCYVIALKPNRESKDLLRGRAWVDARSFLIRRVEGEPAKNLSWWVRDVHITLMYNNVNGMWLRTASQASAHVRFSGDLNFVSRDVDFRQVEDVAALSRSEAAPRESLPKKSNITAYLKHRTSFRHNDADLDEFGGAK